MQAPISQIQWVGRSQPLKSPTRRVFHFLELGLVSTAKQYQPYTYTEPHFEEPQPFSYATVKITETMHAEELEVIPEQAIIKPAAQLSNLHKSPGRPICGYPQIKRLLSQPRLEKRDNIITSRVIRY